MKFILTGLLVIPTLLLAQKKNPLIEPTIDEDSIIKKWTTSILNIEVRSNSVSASGTAIYALHNNNHYLITARHVVEDLSEKDTGRTYSRIFLIQNGSSTLAAKKVINEDESGGGMLMNLNAGRPWDRPFVFSENDLAIIDLSHSGSGGLEFIKILDQRGYRPILISDIDTVDSKKTGVKIMALGFPEESELPRKDLPKALLNWQSALVTLPVVTKGEYLKLVTEEKFFDGNIFVYRGFSGGPIVSGNKLIGIVHGGFPEVKKTSNTSLNSYINHHNIFIKSALILPLLRQLQERFNNR